MEENKESKMKQYLAVIVAGIAGGAIGSMMANAPSQQAYLPEQSSVVIQQTQQQPKLEPPPPVHRENESSATGNHLNQPSIPNAQRGEGISESIPNPSTDKPLMIATVNYEVLMGEHPLVQQAHELMRTDFEETQKRINALPEKDRNEAWQKHDEELMKKIHTEYFDVAKNQVENAIDKVLAEKGIAACMANTQLIRGGIDITKEVKNILDSEKK